MSWKNTKRVFEHPASVVFFLLGKGLRFLLFFLFVYYLLTKTQVLAGYTLPETLVFFCTFTLVDTLAQLLFRSVYTFKPLIASGQFDTILLKPYHPFTSILIGGIDPLDAIMIVPYIILTGIILTRIPELSFLAIAAYIGLLLCSLVIAAGIHIIILAVGLLTIDVDNTVMIYRDTTRLGTFPMAIYSQPLRSILTFILPVGIMMSVPAAVLLGKSSYWWCAVSILFAGGILAVGFVLWRYALRRYQSWGA